MGVKKIEPSIISIGENKQLEDSTKSLIVDFNLDTFFGKYLDMPAAVSDNMSPVVQKKIGIDQHKNIEIYGEFRTSFVPTDSNEGQGISYILTRKNSTGQAMAACGYGVAWRPSYPDAGVTTTISSADIGAGTITLVSDPGFSTDGGLVYVGNQAISYGSISGYVLNDCMFTENVKNLLIAGAAGVTVSMAASNLFIVDNDFVGADIYSGNYQYMGNNMMAYIKAGVAEILSNTQYFFKMTIGSDNAIDFYLSTDSANLNDDNYKVISCGARNVMSEYLGTPDMDAFGLSVIETAGAQWYYDNIKIGCLSNEYPILHSNFYVGDLGKDINVVYRAKGTGYSAGENLEYGLDVYVWNPGTSVWDKISSNSFVTTGANNIPVTSSVFEKGTYATNGYIDVMMLPQYPSGDLADSHAAIEVDFINVVSSRSRAVSIGGTVDVYIDDIYLKQAEATFTVSDRIMSLGTSRAVVWIEGISLGGRQLIEGVDWVWTCNYEPARHSSKVENLLTFSNSITSEVTVSYFYSPAVSNAQKLADNNEFFGFAGQNILVKHLNVVTAEITSSIDQEVANGYLTDYIRTLAVDSDKNLSMSYTDFYAYLSEKTTFTSMYVVFTYRDETGKLTQYAIADKGEVFTVNHLHTFRLAGAISE